MVRNGRTARGPRPGRARAPVGGGAGQARVARASFQVAEGRITASALAGSGR